MARKHEVVSAGILFADVACEPIDHIPHAGELVPTNRIQLGLGGCAANVAVDLARLGIDVGVAGCVGDDPFGRFIAETLGNAGIDTAGVRFVPDRGTAATMMVNVKNEDRRFISTPGANHVFAAEDLPRDWLDDVRVFYVGGYLMMPALETDAFLATLKRLRSQGVKTVLDVVLMGQRDYRSIVSRFLPEVDYFLPNDDEAEIILGVADPLEQAKRFHDAGAANVVITSGSRGSLFWGEGGRFRAGVYPVEFVSGAGAGDAFDAGFIAGLLWGESPVGCIRWGSALGASCVRAIGTTDSVFMKDEALAFMARHSLEIEQLP